jgi:uncharacterized protein YceK
MKKNKLFFMGLTALVLSIGLVLAGCGIVIQKGDGGAYSDGVSILSTNQNAATGWFAKALEWKALD